VGLLFPAESMFAFLADNWVELFLDEQYVDLFPTALGRSSIPATQMAAVLTLQALHELFDQERAEVVHGDQERRGGSEPCCGTDRPEACNPRRPALGSITKERNEVRTVLPVARSAVLVQSYPVEIRVGVCDVYFTFWFGAFCSVCIVFVCCRLKQRHPSTLLNLLTYLKLNFLNINIIALPC